MKVSVVAVGDELVLGDVIDTNSAWVARRLVAAGLEPAGARTVGDDVEAIAAAVRAVALPGTAVLVTGGLGPTSDDLTRQGLAALAGVPLRRDPQVLADIERWYAGRERPVPASSACQADLPEGATVLPNGAGVAPGLRLELGGAVVYAVPGVPQEMEHLVERYVLPDLARQAVPWRRHTLRVALMGEPDVSARLRPLEEELPAGVRIAYLAAPGEVLVTLASRDTDPGPIADRARSLLGDVVSGEDGETPAATVVRLLTARAATIAVAESLTGGLLGASLTAVPGASAVLRGGVVAYASDLKVTLLRVDAALLEREGAVHPDVALAMAAGVRRRCGATFGVATTGVAGPDPQDGRPVGTVHVAVAGPDGARVVSALLGGDRSMVRTQSVAHALDLLRRTVSGLPLYSGE